MNKAEETYQLIDRYLNKEMTAQESVEFELLYNNDSILKEQLDFEKDLNHVIVSASIANLRDEVKNELKAINGQPSKNSRYYLISILGGLIVSAGVFIGYYVNDNSSFDALKNKIETAETGTPSISSNNVITKNFEDITPETTIGPYTNTPIIDQNENKKTIIDTALLDTDPLDSLSTTAIVNNQIDSSVLASTVIPEIDPCLDVNITMDAQSVATCENKSDGEIIITATGGKAPYTYIISNKIASSSHPKNLSIGKYNIIINDQNGCSSTLQTVEVESKICYEVPKAFQPDNASWKHPETQKVKTLQIYNTAGQLIYSTSGKELEWDGTDSHGNDQPQDTYLFTISSEGTMIERNYITLIR